MQDMFKALNDFALTWAIAGMAVFFVLAVLWAFRPGSRQVYSEAANAIFRHDSQPAVDSGERVQRPLASAAVKGA